MIVNETILIFGGSGSLGHALVERYVKNNNNHIVIYSRDESKHWTMSQTFAEFKQRMTFVIGDVRDKESVMKCLLRYKPTIVILASALKHIDKCEYNTHECIMTNIIGMKNVLDSVDELSGQCMTRAVCFISTDKACSPVNVYGMSKAICEGMVCEKAHINTSCKFVTVRYGNVLNSRGSIIPLLHTMGQNPDVKTFGITDERMTRFIMTLDDSVDLIEHAITKAASGDIVISKLRSMYIKDLIEIFSELYGKPIDITGLRPGEKMLEALVNETQSARLVKDPSGFMYIKPSFSGFVSDEPIVEYNSTHGLLNKDELKQLLSDVGLFPRVS